MSLYHIQLLHFCTIYYLFIMYTSPTNAQLTNVKILTH